MSSADPSAAIEVASTLQSASIRRSPSPTHDMNPATAASERIPVTVSEEAEVDEDEAEEIDGVEAIELVDEDEDDEDDDISVSMLKPMPRKHHLPPLPDLRFEQSYLASISKAESWMGVAWITLRDQIIIALAQGFFTSLAFTGWRHWNANANMSGNSAGARLRRWWYRTNNWPIKGETLRSEKVAASVEEFYKYKSY